MRNYRRTRRCFIEVREKMSSKPYITRCYSRAGHSPLGECGLKYVTEYWPWYHKWVTPRLGSVDWNQNPLTRSGVFMPVTPCLGSVDWNGACPGLMNTFIVTPCLGSVDWNLVGFPNTHQAYSAHHSCTGWWCNGPLLWPEYVRHYARLPDSQGYYDEGRAGGGSVSLTI